MNNFQKILCKFSLIALSINFSINTSAFDGPTHEYVTVTAMSGIGKINSKFKDYFSQKEVHDTLQEFCKQPDKDENEGAYKNHFYNRATGSNFLGEYTSAKTKFINHYQNALDEYAKKNTKKSLEELGRSLHFLEDMNTPVHTNYETWTDAVFKFSLHVSFEDRAVEIQKNFEADIIKDNLEYYTTNTLENIAESAAWMSSDNFYALENKLISRDEIIGNAILNAQRYVAGMLYRFYHDISKNSQKN